MSICAGGLHYSSRTFHYTLIIIYRVSLYIAEETESLVFSHIRATSPSSQGGHKTAGGNRGGKGIVMFLGARYKRARHTGSRLEPMVRS